MVLTRAVLSSVSRVPVILVNNNPLIAMHWTGGQKLNIIRITRDSAGIHSSTIMCLMLDTSHHTDTSQAGSELSISLVEITLEWWR